MYENRIGSIRSRFGKHVAQTNRCEWRGVSPSQAICARWGVQSYTLRHFFIKKKWWANIEYLTQSFYQSIKNSIKNTGCKFMQYGIT